MLTFAKIVLSYLQGAIIDVAVLRHGNGIGTIYLDNALGEEFEKGRDQDERLLH